MSAWLFKDDKQVKKLGDVRASWYVGWIDPDGKRRCKSCGPGCRGKSIAVKLRDKVTAELLTGTYQRPDRVTWEAFRKEYQAKVLDGMDVRSRDETIHALDIFETIINPKRIQAVTSRTLADFIAKRRLQRGLKVGSKIAPATVNKELRHLRAVFRKARKLGYLVNVPEIDFLKEAKKLPTYVAPEHFVKIYASCDKARWPADQTYGPGDWWRGLLIMGYMTGWRIGALLAIRQEDVDLAACTALTRADDNKGRRDQKIPLHPIVVEHLGKLANGSALMFPWNYRRASVFSEFAELQKAADVTPEGKAHYGFHDLRRAFATNNADKLTPDALQLLMQHQDYKTTQRYINMSRQLHPAVQNLFVPDVSGGKTASEK